MLNKCVDKEIIIKLLAWEFILKLRIEREQINIMH